MELFNGRPKARCYPFDIEGHRFRNKNQKVCSISDPISCLILRTSHPMSHMISCPISIVLFCMQDCVCLVAPYPFRIEPLDEFNVNRDFNISGAGEVWYARQQLLFRCTLCPTCAMGDACKYKEFALVLFSTFEPISLTPDSCMQQKGVPMLYERSATVLPSLYRDVCPVQNVLGCVPLIPCYLTPGIPSCTCTEAPPRPRRLQTQDPTVGQVADSSTLRSTYGCGATAVRFHRSSLSLMRWQCGRSEFRNPGNRRL